MKSILFSALATQVVADLPVHCLRPQVVGQWRFHLGELSSKRTTCGHKTPDVDKLQPSIDSLEVVKSLDLDFQDPNFVEISVEKDLQKGKKTAKTTEKTDKKKSSEDSNETTETTEATDSSDTADDNDDDSSKFSFLQRKRREAREGKELGFTKKGLAGSKTGSWTMIYDEGLSVSSQDYEFFAFSHFALSNPESTKDYFPQLVHGKKVFRSYCGKTEVGWYQDKKSKKYGCFYGERVEDSDKFSYHLSLLAENFKTQRSTEALSSQFGSAQSLAENVDFSENTADKCLISETESGRKIDHTKMVRKINDSQQSWTAKTYSEDFMNEKLTQLIRKPKVEKKKKEMQQATQKTAMNQQTSGKIAKIAKDLPKNFIWSDVDGVSWVEPVMDQKDCGSCYAVSTVHMLTARYRIYKNDPSIEGFSINFPLYCSDLNQGCNGGFPSLISMWSGHVGLVPKSCTGEYFTSETETCKNLMDKNSDFKTCLAQKSTARVAKWNYVGGYYGGCTVEAMMEDLYKNGPLAVALEPEADFMYYKDGVYKRTEQPTNVPWVKVDHAVLLIGWGEDTDKETGKVTPYWTIQNSWGKDWGEDGTIRLVRGQNESGVEFQAVSATMTDGEAEKILEYVQQF